MQVPDNCTLGQFRFRTTLGFNMIADSVLLAKGVDGGKEWILHLALRFAAEDDRMRRKLFSAGCSLGARNTSSHQRGSFGMTSREYTTR
jgi:hypothetical protein